MTTALTPTWRVGSVLPELELEPVTRTTLALFADGSGDHNPVHLDIDLARAAGHQDVFAQGMLCMAYLGRFVLQHVAQDQIVSLAARFVAITPVGARPRCTGRVVAVDDGPAGRTAHLELAVVLADGTVTVTGTATLTLSKENR